MEESKGIKNLVEDSKPMPEPPTNIHLNSKSTIEWLRKSNFYNLNYNYWSCIFEYVFYNVKSTKMIKC